MTYPMPSGEFGDEYQARGIVRYPDHIYYRICDLVDKGILGRELFPYPKYWHWPILKPDELPEEFMHFTGLGEVRW